MGRIGFAAVLLTLAAAPLFAQSESKELEKNVDEAIEIRQETQKQQDAWEAEKAQLVARYRTAKANIEYLGEKKAVEEKKLTALEASIAELERRLRESVRLQTSLQDTLGAILTELEKGVQRDLPFLLEERTARVASLREELVRPDIEGSEKLRRILEALQIEAGYGSTVEVDQERIEVEREPIFVDRLRVGRVSLFWRTPDGERVGEFDRASGRWVELPGKYNRGIGSAMEMASRIRPVEVLALPLGRIQP
jgi:DNA repair exonuclease SbcCD ATPase subunit